MRSEKAISMLNSKVSKLRMYLLNKTRLFMWWRTPLCRLVVNIEQGDCPSMNSVWTTVVFDLNDLM